MPRVTLQTVADRVGVSRMTVSNAFSRPDQLSPALRAKILEAADALGYLGPDPAGRALARGTTGAVGVLLFDSLQTAFTDEIATAFLGAVADALGPSGLALTLLTTTTEEGPVIPARDVALDGALVYSCDAGSPGTAWLMRRKLPLVMVDQVPRPGFPNVNIDDRGGARAAAQHLVDLGHRSIGMLSYGVGAPFGLIDEGSATFGHVSRERVSGWMDALRPAGVRTTLFQQPSQRPGLDAETLEAFLARPDPPTAILCFSDVTAQGIVTAAQDRGLRVPEDLSVVGFDDSPLAIRMRPTLTTVRQDVEAKGRAAIEALTLQLAGGTPDPMDVVLPVELVVRDSTAPPPGRKPPDQ